MAAGFRQQWDRVEWPTIGMLCVCYGAWGAAVWTHEALGPFLFALVAGAATALHASLQHEALHGHPTRSAALNEALVFPSLNLVFPYRRFRDLHLRHHRDENLTDPFDDPESWYLAEAETRRLSPAMTLLLRANATLAGRLALGPWLSVIGMWRSDLRRWRDGAEGVRIRDAYTRHVFSAGLVIALAVGLGGVPLWQYALCATWPGLALLMLRTYAEHRAAREVDERTAVLEAEAPFALLFLNNNLHAVHHAHPRRPWYELPAIWRRERETVLRRNGGYLIQGYRELILRWLLRAKEPVAHPHLRRERAAAGEAPGSARAGAQIAVDAATAAPEARG